MNEEDAFHAHLDQFPDDHTARQVFADWLDEHNDPRGPGYRALGKLGKTPENHKGSHRWWGAREDTHQNQSYFLPRDWAIATAMRRPELSGGHPYTSRREAEDHAAHAFSALPEGYQQGLLNPDQAQHLSRRARAFKLARRK